LVPFSFFGRLHKLFYSLAIDRAIADAKSSFVTQSSVNQMQHQVSTGKAPRTVERVDKGRQDQHEKDHVHLKGGHALNKDGTWKHGGRELTKSEKEWLKENGWELPSEESKSDSENKSSNSDKD